jgi:hypothetical protein
MDWAHVPAQGKLTTQRRKKRKIQHKKADAVPGRINQIKFITQEFFCSARKSKF